MQCHSSKEILKLQTVYGIILNLLVKVLVTIGSVATIGFGIWHFFIPKIWKWQSYIDVNATELVLAIRAINAFFSLSLVLFGIMNLLFMYADKPNRYSIMVTLASSSVLWVTRVAFQIIYPQGSMNPTLQYGMLSVFIVVFLCYAISLVIMLTRNAVA